MASPGSFNTPEKWLRGLLSNQIRFYETGKFQFPREVAQGTTNASPTKFVAFKFQFPREVAQGTTLGEEQGREVVLFQFPREVAQGTTVKLSSKKTPFLAPFNNILFSFHFSMNIFQDHLRTPDPFPRPPSLLPEPSGKNFFNLLSDNRLNLCVIIKEEPVHTLPARFFSPIQFFSSSISHKKSTTGRSPLPDP